MQSLTAVSGLILLLGLPPGFGRVEKSDFQDVRKPLANILRKAKTFN